MSPMISSSSPQGDMQPGNWRLRALAVETSAIVWFTAPDGTFAEHNPAWEAYTGQTFGQYAQWGWLEAVHPDDVALVRQQWHGGRGTSPMSFRYRLRHHDGKFRALRAHGNAFIRDGEIVEWIGICTDDSANQQEEADLRASAESYKFLDRLGEATRTLTDAVHVMAVTARMLGSHIGATRCAYADVEADSDHFTIRNDWSVEGVPSSAGVYSLELFGPEATSRLRRGQHLVVRDVDRELGDAGGGEMFNAIGIQAIICAGLVKEGRLVAMMAVHQSTPRNWSAGEIALVGEVVERCWAHIERVRDNAILRDQDRRKDQFIATLAHELRNPLAPIKYALAIARRDTTGAYSVKANEIIDRQVSLMARLIDDLLDLSRISRGLIELKPERVDLCVMARNALDTARPAIEGARHALEISLPPGPLWLRADPARLVQVIGNLLNNAAKYTPDGGRIRLAARSTGDHAVLEISDNGVGIPQEEQGQLFQMFTQLEHTAGRAQGGLGIGLALVKTLTGMHGGTVRVASEGLDQGSTFTVELPLAAPSTETPVDPRREGITPGRTGRRVLVVEDNEDGLETLVALLQALGYAVAGAADGHAALEVARKFLPEIVLLDIGLPGMDGVEVARALRADPQFQDVYLIALTGWGTERDRTRTAAAGFDAHLTKPVEPDTLQNYLAQADRRDN